MAAGYQAVAAIEVMAWGKNVGASAFDPNQRAYVFEYTPAWIKTGIALAPPAYAAATAALQLSRSTA